MIDEKRTESSDAQPGNVAIFARQFREVLERILLQSPEQRPQQIRRRPRRKLGPFSPHPCSQGRTGHAEMLENTKCTVNAALAVFAGSGVGRYQPRGGISLLGEPKTANYGLLRFLFSYEGV